MLLLTTDDDEGGLRVPAPTLPRGAGGVGIGRCQPSPPPSAFVLSSEGATRPSSPARGQRRTPDRHTPPSGVRSARPCPAAVILPPAAASPLVPKGFSPENHKDRRPPTQTRRAPIQTYLAAGGGGVQVDKALHTSGVGVSCSQISQLAAEVKEKGGNRGKWRRMEKNGGEWGDLGYCGRSPKVHCGECRKKCVKFVGNGYGWAISSLLYATPPPVEMGRRPPGGGGGRSGGSVGGGGRWGDLTFLCQRALCGPLTPPYVPETAQKGPHEPKILCRFGWRQPQTKNRPYLWLHGSKRDSEGTYSTRNPPCFVVSTPQNFPNGHLDPRTQAQ